MKKRDKKEPISKSKGHIIVGEILKNMFPISKIYEEYKYNRLLLMFYKKNSFVVRDNALIAKAGRLRADWVVLDKRLIVEIQGDQHYGPVRFGGSVDSSEMRYYDQKINDNTKRIIANEMNWLLVEIPYIHGVSLNENYVRGIITNTLLSS
jgi:hypothetical protein